MQRHMDGSLDFLISEVSRLIRRRFDQCAPSIGMKRAQWRGRTTPFFYEGLNQGALADLLEVEPMTLSRTVDRLEGAGLVARRRDPADPRAWLIFCHPKARRIIDQFHALAEDMFAHALEGSYASNREAMFATLNAMRANLALEEPNMAAHG